jgi:hypothetical protein
MSASSRVRREHKAASKKATCAVVEPDHPPGVELRRIEFLIYSMPYLVGFERAASSTEGGGAEDLVLRVTQVYRRERGEWKQVHRHADPGPGKAQVRTNSARRCATSWVVRRCLPSLAHRVAMAVGDSPASRRYTWVA